MLDCQYGKVVVVTMDSAKEVILPPTSFLEALPLLLLLLLLMDPPMMIFDDEKNPRLDSTARVSSPVRCCECAKDKVPGARLVATL